MSQRATPSRPPRERHYLGKASAWARRNGPGAAVELLVNFALPFLTFVVARPSLGDVFALMAASAPPIAWTIIEFARKRRIDALSLLVLFGIALSFLAFLGGGGARLLQLRERLATAAIGLVFLGSAAIGRPLIYQLARATMKRKSPLEVHSFEALQESPLFRRAMMVMTLAWGTGLVVESAISCVLVFTLTIPQYLLVNPIVGYSAAGALTAWTFWYAGRRVRAARQAVAKESSEHTAEPDPVNERGEGRDEAVTSSGRRRSSGSAAATGATAPSTNNNARTTASTAPPLRRRARTRRAPSAP